VGRSGCAGAHPPPPPTAAGLAAAVVAAAGERAGAAIVQGRRARPTLASALRAAGWEVRVATVYDTVTLSWRVQGPVDAVLLASPSAVEALPVAVAEGARLVAIGPTTGRAVRARGFDVRVAAAPTVAAVVAALTGVSGASPDGAPATAAAGERP
jgi:uroporphyrinogen-III synthase